MQLHAGAKFVNPLKDSQDFEGLPKKKADHIPNPKQTFAQLLGNASALSYSISKTGPSQGLSSMFWSKMESKLEQEDSSTIRTKEVSQSREEISQNEEILQNLAKKEYITEKKEHAEENVLPADKKKPQNESALDKSNQAQKREEQREQEHSNKKLELPSGKAAKLSLDARLREEPLPKGPEHTELKKAALQEHSKADSAPRVLAYQSIEEDFVRVRLDPAKWSIQGEGRQEHKPSFHQEGAAQTQPFILQGKRKEAFDSHHGSNKQRQNARIHAPHSGDEALALLHKPQSPSPFLKELSSLASKQKGHSQELYNRLVAKAKLNLHNDGSSHASIRLRPQSLGSITLNIKALQKQVEAQVIVETRAAQRLVLEELHSLRKELQSQGIHIDQLSVRVRSAPENQSLREGAEKQGDEAMQDGHEQESQQKGRAWQDDHIYMRSKKIVEDLNAHSAEDYEAMQKQNQEAALQTIDINV